MNSVCKLKDARNSPYLFAFCKLMCDCNCEPPSSILVGHLSHSWGAPHQSRVMHNSGPYTGTCWMLPLRFCLIPSRLLQPISAILQLATEVQEPGVGRKTPDKNQGCLLCPRTIFTQLPVCMGVRTQDQPRSRGSLDDCISKAPEPP